jgi:hypothetical protein
MAKNRATGPGPVRTARGAGLDAGRRDAGRFLAAVFDRDFEAGVRPEPVLRLVLVDRGEPVLRDREVEDVLLLRDPGGEDVRVAMVPTLRSRHTSHTHHRSACLPR